MTYLRVLALLLPLSLSVLSFDEAEMECSYGTLEYLCENYEVCSEYGLIDEETRSVLCGANLDDPNGGYDPSSSSSTYGPSQRNTAPTEPQRPTFPQTERVTDAAEITTGYDLTTETGVETRQPITGSRTEDDNSFTTFYTTADTKVPTEEPVANGSPPEILSPPVNITVAPGGTGRFECAAKAATTPQITITKKDQTSRPSPDSFKEVTGGSLTSQTTINSIVINNVDHPNAGWYTCLACNRYGCAEHDAYLHVKDLCEGVTCDGERVCVGDYEAGEGYTCECPQYCGYEDLVKTDWVCSNYCEESFNECQMKADACRNDKFGIEVLNKGRCGKIQDPEIVEEADYAGVQELMEGDNMVLECHAVGFPEPEIIWYHGEEIVGYGNQLSKSVSVEDTGEYICQAVNCMTTKVNRRLAVVLVIPVPTPPAPTTPDFPTTPDLPTTTPTQEPDDIKQDAPRSTCAVFGDPHFMTFDNHAYSYMGKCDNVLAMDCEHGRWFVYGRMRPCGKSGGSCLQSVTAHVDSEALQLQRGWLVNRNGKKLVTKNRPNQDILVEGKHNNFTLHFDGAMLSLTAVLDTRQVGPGVWEEDKLVIYWDGYMSAQIQTPANSRTCGMCGNNDGNPDNEFRTRRSGMTKDPVVFGDSWTIGRSKKRCGAPAKTSEEVCGASYKEVKAECERIFNISKFEQCIAGGHDTTQWVDSCIYDQCEGQLQREELPPKCVVAQAYATRCGNEFWALNDISPRLNMGVDGWEKEAGCPVAEARFEPVLDTGCPQPTWEEELAGDY